MSRKARAGSIPALGTLFSMIYGFGELTSIRRKPRLSPKLSLPPVTRHLEGGRPRAGQRRYTLLRCGAGRHALGSLSIPESRVPATPHPLRDVLSVSNSLSSRHWELHETPAVGRPTPLVKFGAGTTRPPAKPNGVRPSNDA